MYRSIAHAVLLCLGVVTPMLGMASEPASVRGFHFDMTLSQARDHARTIGGGRSLACVGDLYTRARTPVALRLRTVEGSRISVYPALDQPVDPNATIRCSFVTWYPQPRRSFEWYYLGDEATLDVAGSEANIRFDFMPQVEGRPDLSGRLVSIKVSYQNESSSRAIMAALRVRHGRPVEDGCNDPREPRSDCAVWQLRDGITLDATSKIGLLYFTYRRAGLTGILSSRAGDAFRRDVQERARRF